MLDNYYCFWHNKILCVTRELVEQDRQGTTNVECKKNHGKHTILCIYVYHRPIPCHTSIKYIRIRKLSNAHMERVKMFRIDDSKFREYILSALENKFHQGPTKIRTKTEP